MGGEVGVESEVGRGSRFWVTLPVAALSVTRRPAPLGRGKKILVVDDLAVCREGLATKLGLFSFEAVTAVGSVDEALAAARRQARASTSCSPTSSCPCKGGLDLLAALRADPRYERLPFVLLSLFGSDHAAVADRPHQPDAIGLKPIRAIKLAMLLDKVLTGERRALGECAAGAACQPDLPRPPRPPGRGQPGESARRAAAAAEARRPT